MAFEATPDIAGRPFQDLRSARRAANRERKHNTRYNNFKQITPSDLPSHPKQQPHILPTCRYAYCSSNKTIDHGPWHAFTADFPTATPAKFTKREAYDYVKNWRNAGPRRHDSRVKADSPKHQRQKVVKHVNTNEAHTRNGDWIGDIDWYNYVDWEFEMDIWLPWFDEGPVFEEEEEDEEEDEGYYSDNDGKREFVGDIEWNWHRNQDGLWYATGWRCAEGWCNCDEFEEEERTEPGEAEANAREELEEKAFDECDVWGAYYQAVAHSDAESDAEIDWDVVSMASEAWTEVDEHDSGIVNW